MSHLTTPQDQIKSLGDGLVSTFGTDISDLPAGTWEPVHVAVVTAAARSTIPPSGAKLDGHQHVLRVGGVQGDLDKTFIVGEDISATRTDYEVNPADGSSWALGDLEGLEIGIRSRLNVEGS